MSASNWPYITLMPVLNVSVWCTECLYENDQDEDNKFIAFEMTLASNRDSSVQSKLSLIYCVLKNSKWDSLIAKM